MEDIKQKKFIENVSEVESLINDFNVHVSSLADKISDFGGKISELKKIENLNNSLSNLSNTISFLDQCNNKINEAYKGVNNFASLEENINKTNDDFLSIKNSLETINKKIENIEDNQDGFNIDGLITKIQSIDNKFVMLNTYVKENIIQYLDENLKKTVDDLKTEIDGIKTSFNSYKNETNTLIETLKLQNETIDKEFKKSIEYNEKIISMFNEFKNKNADVEKFMNDFMTKWYKENVSIFGMKKNKKD